ncbi:hypothetical protein GCM10007977_086300 [Dactylosporangium sucinum]|uniref:Transposase n=1 Tax=Dactylosporangium sucinum TaxID=1424081 RepID=A0A917X5H7_9ACTN|nr:hypothetical protein GCM10007977_086300 [Dactylosporangium sucinum]
MIKMRSARAPGFIRGVSASSPGGQQRARSHVLSLWLSLCGRTATSCSSAPSTSCGARSTGGGCSATSDGETYNREFVTAGEAKRLERLQQSLSRSLRTHGRSRRSTRRDATRAKLGRLNARIRARRTDFAAQTAVQLVRNHEQVAVEDLHTRTMTASAKGTVAAPGRNVRQKAGLNRAILGKGWGRFLLRLEHSARYHGATVVKVNPAYTSQRCSRCNLVDADSRKSQAEFACTGCGHRDNADVNAAKNVLAAGLAVTGRGDLADRRSAKRQPPERRAA